MQLLINKLTFKNIFYDLFQKLTIYWWQQPVDILVTFAGISEIYLYGVTASANINIIVSTECMK